MGLHGGWAKLFGGWRVDHAEGEEEEAEEEEVGEEVEAGEEEEAGPSALPEPETWLVDVGQGSQ